MSIDDKALTYAESAELLGIRISTLYSMVSRKQIPHLRLGRRLVRFSRSRLIEWLGTHEVMPANEVRPREAKVGAT